MNTRLPATLCIIIATALPASAQFVGTDDFGNATNWTDQTDYDVGDGIFTVTNNRLEYTVGTPNSNTEVGDSRIYTWRVAESVPTGSDWSAKVDVFLPHPSMNSDTQFANLNLVLNYGLPDSGNLMLVALDNYYTGTNPVYGFEASVFSGGTEMANPYVTIDTTQASLGVNYYEASEQVVAMFDPDGSGVNYGWYEIATATVTDFWPTFPANNLYVSLVGGSAGLDLSSGDAYFDNFEVSTVHLSFTAVPEPSTWAGLAGLAALGLAFWRRRKLA